VRRKTSEIELAECANFSAELTGMSETEAGPAVSQGRFMYDSSAMRGERRAGAGSASSPSGLVRARSAAEGVS